ncbi:hypothetical protein [Pseudogracilibacillus sp. SO30301A]|uniref:hypothetical protein n=1 Tax=Pseudogracilibacillus sp. SO30301A TaxID=3098291 RepID=UPI00300E5476
MDSSKVRGSLVVFALAFRTILFILFAFIFTTYFSIQEVQNPWDEAINWWVYQAIFASIITFAILIWLLKREGIKYLQFIDLRRSDGGRI